MKLLYNAEKVLALKLVLAIFWHDWYKIMMKWFNVQVRCSSLYLVRIALLLLPNVSEISIGGKTKTFS